MRRLAVLPFGLVVCVTGGLNAQAACRTSTESGHSAWQQDWMEANNLKERVTEMIRSSGGDPSGGVVFARSDKADGGWSTRMVDLSLSPEVAAHVEQLVKDYAARLPSTRSELTMELGAPEIPLWEDRTEDCAPALTNRSELAKELDRVGRSLGRTGHVGPRTGAPERVDLEPGTEVRVVCRILIDSEGAVRYAEVMEDETLEAWRDLESDLTDIVLQMRFRPATKNGVPIAFWADLPISLILQ